MVPDGWKWRAIGDVCAVQIGGTPARNEARYWDSSRRSGNAWASIADIPDSRFLKETKEYITDDGIRESSVKLVPAGTPMMSFKLSIGRVAIAARDLYTNEAIASFIVREPKAVDSDFLFYQLPIAANRGVFDHAVKGRTLNKAKLNDLPLLLPPLAEQKKIAEILGSVDDAIAATKTVIEQTKQVKKGLLQELLTKGIGHTKFKQTPIGKIPESWELAQCEHITDRISVGIVVKPTQYYVESGVPCFRSANVAEGFVRDSAWVYISPESNEELSKSRLQVGDVLVVRTGYPGTSCVVPQTYDGTNCVDIIFARPRTNLMEPKFLSWFVNSAPGKRQVLGAQGGLAQQHFNVGEMKKMLVPRAPLTEQREIVARIDAVHDAETAHRQTSASLERLKTGLLQDLLTGRVRVSV